jgi:outer membrane protein assembly factor BamB
MSWASPICVNTGSRAELILADCEALTSYDPAGGSVLWRAACLRGEVGTSPAFADGMVFAANDGAPAAAIALSNRTARIAWKSDAAAPDTASPLAAGGYVFLATSGGTVVCLRARTGEVAWEHEFGEGFYSSPIAVEGRVYAQDRSGVTHVFAVAGEYRGMSEGRVGEQTGATPAFAGKRIYIRGAERLFCIGERSGP